MLLWVSKIVYDNREEHFRRLRTVLSVSPVHKFYFLYEITVFGSDSRNVDDLKWLIHPLMTLRINYIPLLIPQMSCLVCLWSDDCQCLRPTDSHELTRSAPPMYQRASSIINPHKWPQAATCEWTYLYCLVFSSPMDYRSVSSFLTTVISVDS